MARKTPGARSELLHCDACGEDYSSTYKRCPFCGAKQNPLDQTQPLPQEEDDYVFQGGSVFDELEEEQEAPPRRPRGGKRLADSGGSSRRSGAARRSDNRDGGLFAGLSPVRVAGFAFTLVVIIAAFVIVTKVIVPMIDRGSAQVPEDGPGQSEPADPPGSASPDLDASQPPVSPDPQDTTDPEPTDTVPAGQTATGFTLDRTEFTISDRYPDPVQITATLTPAGSTGTITWTSSDESVVTVSASGLVTAVGKGSATITAALPGGVTQTCRVISSVSNPTPPVVSTSPSASPSPSPSASQAPSGSGSLTLSREDFTMTDTWPSYTFEVTGASGSVTWSTSDSSVATVDSSGKVTKAGTGMCTITATDGAGNTASCIVRCR